MIEDILKEKGLKITSHRVEVYNKISELEEVDIDSLYNNLDIDKVTLYRIIKLFLKYNIINKNASSNCIYYNVNSINHTHYMTCLKCHKKISFDFSLIEKQIDDLCKENNFILKSHSINLEGICSDCNK